MFNTRALHFSGHAQSGSAVMPCESFVNHPKSSQSQRSSTSRAAGRTNELGVPEAMTLLGVSRTTLWRMRHRYPAFPKPRRNARGRWAFARAELLDWQRAHAGRCTGEKEHASPDCPSLPATSLSFPKTTTEVAVVIDH